MNTILLFLLIFLFGAPRVGAQQNTSGFEVSLWVSTSRFTETTQGGNDTPSGPGAIGIDYHRYEPKWLTSSGYGLRIGYWFNEQIAVSLGIASGLRGGTIE